MKEDLGMYLISFNVFDFILCFFYVQSSYVFVNCFLSSHLAFVYLIANKFFFDRYYFSAINFLFNRIFFHQKSKLGPKGPTVAAEGYSPPQDLEKRPP